MTDHQALLRHRMIAAFREHPEISGNWGRALAHAVQALEGLEALGWSKSDITHAQQELCRSLMAISPVGEGQP